MYDPIFWLYVVAAIVFAVTDKKPSLSTKIGNSNPLKGETR